MIPNFLLLQANSFDMITKRRRSQTGSRSESLSFRLLFLKLKLCSGPLGKKYFLDVSLELQYRNWVFSLYLFKNRYLFGTLLCKKNSFLDLKKGQSFNINSTFVDPI